MRLIHFFATALLSICILLVSSCSGDDGLFPISLKDGSGTNIRLYYPQAQPFSYPLQGGDGNYAVTCDNPEIVTARLLQNTETSEKALSLTALARGEATVIITDQSDHSLTVNVKVDYYTQEFIVGNCDLLIRGNVNDVEKEAITEKAQATIPVAIGGGYKFIYTNAEEAKGTVLMYKEKYGKEAVEGTFERVRIKQEDEASGSINLIGYELTFPDKRYSFRLSTYQRSGRAEMLPVMAFYEDITDAFADEYPSLESLYTVQVLSQVSDLFY